MQGPVCRVQKAFLGACVLQSLSMYVDRSIYEVGGKGIC